MDYAFFFWFDVLCYLYLQFISELHTMIAAQDNLLFGLLSDMFRVCSLSSKKAPDFLRLQYRFEYPLFYSIFPSAFAQLV